MSLKKKKSNEIVYNNSFHLPQFTLCHDLKRKCNSDFRLSEISSGKKIIRVSWLFKEFFYPIIFQLHLLPGWNKSALKPSESVVVVRFWPGNNAPFPLPKPTLAIYVIWLVGQRPRNFCFWLLLSSGHSSLKRIKLSIKSKKLLKRMRH